MKAILLGILLCAGTVLFAQPVDTVKTEINNFDSDSIVAALKKKNDSIAAAIYQADSNRRKQQFQNNTNYILELQQENRDKQRKAAIVRIAIGVGFLVILIIGLLRRNKIQSKTK